MWCIFLIIYMSKYEIHLHGPLLSVTLLSKPFRKISMSWENTQSIFECICEIVHDISDSVRPNVLLFTCQKLLRENVCYGWYSQGLEQLSTLLSYLLFLVPWSLVKIQNSLNALVEVLLIYLEGKSKSELMLSTMEPWSL